MMLEAACFPTLFFHVRIEGILERGPSPELNHASTLILNFKPSGQISFYSHLIYGTIKAAQTDSMAPCIVSAV